MNEPVKFSARVKAVTVKEKIIKEKDEIDVVEKVGTLTLEFNGDRVNAGQLAELISDASVYIGLANTQFEFDLDGAKLRQVPK